MKVISQFSGCYACLEPMILLRSLYKIRNPFMEINAMLSAKVERFQNSLLLYAKEIRGKKSLRRYSVSV